jgi:hypothetical protein
VALLEVRGAGGGTGGVREVRLNCRVANALTAPNKPLTTTLRTTVRLDPSP